METTNSAEEVSDEIGDLHACDVSIINSVLDLLGKFWVILANRRKIQPI